ncbi:MAG: hypothetical protein NZ583_08200 [Desulfobacterota bacterium]|nr:hypothetical protein [Thermodesulfobacteriota bacterium]MDW8002782.1 hypothetical protein [Deltaproteobacteria bacterium]
MGVSSVVEVREPNEWNGVFSYLGVTLYPIPPSAKHVMGVIESSHRTNDE